MRNMSYEEPPFIIIANVFIITTCSCVLVFVSAVFGEVTRRKAALVTRKENIDLETSRFGKPILYVASCLFLASLTCFSIFHFHPAALVADQVLFLVSLLLTLPHLLSTKWQVVGVVALFEALYIAGKTLMPSHVWAVGIIATVFACLALSQVFTQNLTKIELSALLFVIGLSYVVSHLAELSAGRSLLSHNTISFWLILPQLGARSSVTLGIGDLAVGSLLACFTHTCFAPTNPQAFIYAVVSFGFWEGLLKVFATSRVHFIIGFTALPVLIMIVVAYAFITGKLKNVSTQLSENSKTLQPETAKGVSDYHSTVGV